MKQLRFFHGKSPSLALPLPVVAPRVSLRELHRFPSRLAHESGDNAAAKLHASVRGYNIFTRTKNSKRSSEIAPRARRDNELSPSFSIVSAFVYQQHHESNLERESKRGNSMAHALKCRRMLLCFTRVSLSFLSPFFPRSNSNFGWLDFDNCDNSTTRRQSDSIFTHRYARLLRRSSFARQNPPILNSHRDTFSCSVVYKIKDI